MFGYVVISQNGLTEEQRARYKAYYCGICRSLCRRHGAASGMILSYDMTFLVMLLTSLYEPETESGRERCRPHPLKEHEYLANCFSDYCADMSVLLAYHKAADDWKDERKVSSRMLMNMLRGEYAAAAEVYPRQARAVERCMDDLGRLEKAGICDPDAAAQSFGRLMRELFIYRHDNWSGTMGGLAAALGQFIYILDAFVDLKGDMKHGRYNPLSEMRRDGATAGEIEGILTMLIGECALNFERLPLVEDVDIMRNIIYSGVWTKFPFGMSREERKGGDVASDK